MRLLHLTLAACAALGLTTSSFADWPTFRGADRSGIAPDKGLLKSWPEAGPKLLWETKGAGRGYASPAIAEGKIITLGDGPSVAEDKDEYLLCFDLKTGEFLWKTKTGQPWNSGQPDWQGSRSTPTIDGDRVYVITPNGVLVCCQTADGKELWRKDLKKEFGGDKADSWGYSESPLVDGDFVVCTPGKEKATMVALHKKTGETIWMCSREGDIGAGHASIAISHIGGVKVYVTTTGSGVMGVRASDGKLLWKHDFGKRITAVIPTPIIKDDLVFVPVGYRHGGALFRQIPGENGAVSVEVVYDFKPNLANKHGGVVLVGDYLYGDSDDQGVPYCAELTTGEIKWKERGPGSRSAAVSAADGCLYVRFQDGTMALIEASPESRKVLGAFKIPGSGNVPSWAHPVINDGKLYLREGDSILCYDLRG
jgi:outer membrane protein assembly factor BamB